MAIQVSGSVAFDTIMVFEGRFAEQILPDQVQMLNVAFLAPSMRQEFGGCAANIAYSLRALGSDVRVIGAIGRDGGPYRSRLESLGVDCSGLLQREDCFTAQAFITTDLDDNQITAFHPGAMNHAHEKAVVSDHNGLGIVSPNGKTAMLTHAQQFHAQGIPFVFDPGQAMPIFEADELEGLIRQASWLAVNAYEGEMLSRKVGQPLEQLSTWLKPHAQGGLIMTQGAAGATIIIDGQRRSQPAVAVSTPVDPTGCGDAFRAGLLHALSKGHSLEKAVSHGIVLGAIKVQSRGGQNHTVSETMVADMLSNLS
jgi:adenosine kinase